MSPNPNLNDPKLRNTFFVATALMAVAAAYAYGSQISAAATSSPQARLTLAEKALAAGNGSEARTLLLPLAKAGNAKANYDLADIYTNGLDTPKDETQAIRYLTKAANKGLVQAEASLGRLYMRGDQTTQDFAKAQTWLSKAALQGNAASERRLGQLYQEGLGVPQSTVKAYAWYENAVLRGDIRAGHLRDKLVAKLGPTILAKAEVRAKSLDSQIDHVA